MIAAYNRNELLLAVLSAVGAVICYSLAFYFFRFTFSFSVTAFEFPQLSEYSSLVATGMLVVISISGYRVWRHRGGLYSYHQSGLYHRVREQSSGGAYMVSFYAHRVTGNAYLLSQVFLSAPLLALGAWSHLHNRIPAEPGLESRLYEVLGRLRDANKWQGESDYPDSLREILLLARMRLIDFSAAKGSARFKVRT